MYSFKELEERSLKILERCKDNEIIKKPVLDDEELEMLVDMIGVESNSNKYIFIFGSMQYEILDYAKIMNIINSEEFEQFDNKVAKSIRSAVVSNNAFDGRNELFPNQLKGVGSFLYDNFINAYQLELFRYKVVNSSSRIINNIEYLNAINNVFVDSIDCIDAIIEYSDIYFNNFKDSTKVMVMSVFNKPNTALQLEIINMSITKKNLTKKETFIFSEDGSEALCLENNTIKKLIHSDKHGDDEYLTIYVNTEIPTKILSLISEYKQNMIVVAIANKIIEDRPELWL